MGVVYDAEQKKPVRRRVALKVMKVGQDTKEVVARFEAERQALALMDHPNIAKVFDAGVTDSGRPYFVMELVRGIDLDDYCDEQFFALVRFSTRCSRVRRRSRSGRSSGLTMWATGISCEYHSHIGCGPSVLLGNIKELLLSAKARSPPLLRLAICQRAGAAAELQDVSQRGDAQMIGNSNLRRGSGLWPVFMVVLIATGLIVIAGAIEERRYAMAGALGIFLVLAFVGAWWVRRSKSGD